MKFGATWAFLYKYSMLYLYIYIYIYIMPPSWNHDTKFTTGHLKWWCLLDVFTAGKFKSVPRIILPHRHHAEGHIIYKSM